MTAKQMAVELVQKYDEFPLTLDWKKECAVIAANCVIGNMEHGDKNLKFWIRVIDEIRKLEWEDIL